MQTAQAVFNKSLTRYPVTTNMDVANMINARMVKEDYPYFNQDVHQFLISKGAEFTDKGNGKFIYTLDINGELVRFYFKEEWVFIQYRWVEEDEQIGNRVTWLTDHKFTNPGVLHKFKSIINAYLML